MWLLGQVIVCFFMCCMVGCLSVSGPACAWGEGLPVRPSAAIVW